jgi:hypothetical protein
MYWIVSAIRNLPWKNKEIVTGSSKHMVTTEHSRPIIRVILKGPANESAIGERCFMRSQGVPELVSYIGSASDGEITWARDELWVDRQRKGKNRAAAAFASYTHRTAVRFNNRLRNWQSHSCSWDQLAVVLPAI